MFNMHQLQVATGNVASGILNSAATALNCIAQCCHICKLELELELKQVSSVATAALAMVWLMSRWTCTKLQLVRIEFVAVGYSTHVSFFRVVDICDSNATAW